MYQIDSNREIIGSTYTPTFTEHIVHHNYYYISWLFIIQTLWSPFFINDFSFFIFYFNLISKDMFILANILTNSSYEYEGSTILALDTFCVTLWYETMWYSRWACSYNIIIWAWTPINQLKWTYSRIIIILTWALTWDGALLNDHLVTDVLNTLKHLLLVLIIINRDPPIYTIKIYSTMDGLLIHDLFKHLIT
jgi:hypothetical protein